MKDYRYHHMLDAGDPNLADPKVAPILRAAFRVMEYAHRNPDGTPTSRGKIDPSIRYTSHTIMVYHLLSAMGEKEPIVLAAALLHDALEDCKEFRENPQAMHNMLVQELMTQGFGAYHAITISEMIGTICAQVKNAEARRMDKAISQMEEVRHMGHEAKILKIADQAASIYCHLLMADDTSRGKAKAVKFAHKAHNLVRKIVEHPTKFEDGKMVPVTEPEMRELARWDSLFMKLYEANTYLLGARTRAEEEAAREGFRKNLQYHLLEHIDRREKSVKRRFRLDDVGIASVDLIKKPGDEMAQDGMLCPAHCGVNRVGLNRRGEVVRFTVWVAPEASPQDPRNQMLAALSERIAAEPVGLLHIDDSQLHSVVLDAGDGEQRTVNEGQRLIFERPMRAKDFLDMALEVGAITPLDKRVVLAQARDLYVNACGLNSGGRNALGR